jgi:hypothetical protein
MFSSSENVAHGDDVDHILLSIYKMSTVEYYWPETVRLLLNLKVKADGDTKIAFGSLAPAVESIQSKLIGFNPKNFARKFTYEEKIALFSVLIDGIHELSEFRQILSQRLEEKTAFNKDKIEIYQ